MAGGQDLERRILAAHRDGDGGALAVLYGCAGREAEEAGRIDKACFFYTQAYVFALEAGEEGIAGEMHARLVSHRREE